MKRILSFLILFMSLTASSFAVAETTLLEDATYFASEMYEASSDNLVSMIRKKRIEIGSNKSWVDKEEVEELNEYVTLNHVDCMKEHYINNNAEMREKNKAGMRFFADALRNAPYDTDLFTMDRMTGKAIDRFLNSKYKGVKSKEEAKEKIKEDYGFNVRNLTGGFVDIFYKSSVTEYCKSKSIEEKVTEIAKQ